MSLKDNQGNAVYGQASWVKRQREKHTANDVRKPVGLLAELGHDLRASIVSVLGYVEIIGQSNSADAASHDAVHGIQGNARHMLDLVETILATAQMNSEDVNVGTAIESPEALVQEVIDNLASQAAKQGCSMTLIVGTQTPRNLSMNVVCIRRVLQNLLTNAVKHGGAGRIFIHVDTEERRSGPNYAHKHVLKLEVRDRGPGMSREQIEQIFEPHESTLLGRGDSFGLGLAITRKLVESMGGDISVSSRLSEGTIFRVEVPVALAFRRNLGEPSELEAPALPSNKVIDGRVLVLDDDHHHLELIRFFLDERGVSADIASDAHSALSGENTLYDAMVLDLQMPNIDVPSLVRGLRSAGFDRPIFALSAHGRDIEEIARRDGWHNQFTQFFYKSDGLSKIANELTCYMTAKGHWQCQTFSQARASKFERLVRDFLRKAPKMIANIRAAIGDEQYDEAAKLAHRLAGSSGLYGYRQLSDMARSLQRSLERRGTSHDVLQRHVEELEEGFKGSLDHI